MNKQKRVVAILLTVSLMFVFIIITLSGCFFSFLEPQPAVKEYKTVSSIQDLMNMQEDGYYSLSADIDFEGESWTAVSVKGFDGNGHTISNCIINVGVAFFDDVDSISDITFDSIIVMAGKSICAGSVSQRIANVTVKNSQLTVAGSGNIGIIAGSANNMENCEVVGCEIKCGLLKNSALIGGLAGSVDGEVDSCYLSDVDINAVHNSASDKSTFCVGGLIGKQLGGDVTECSVSHAQIRVEATDEDSGVSIGGLIGYSEPSKVSYCFTEDTTIEVSAQNEVRIGGLIGITYSTISNSYTSNNTMSCIVGVAKNSYIGGFSASAMEVTQSCFSANNCLIGKTPDDNVYVAGFCPNVQKAINYCGVLDNTMTGTNIDEFAFESDMIFNSFVTDTAQYVNVNDLEAISSMDWFSPTIIAEKLKLSQSKWKFEVGQLPFLAF